MEKLLTLSWRPLHFDRTVPSTSPEHCATTALNRVRTTQFPLHYKPHLSALAAQILSDILILDNCRRLLASPHPSDLGGVQRRTGYKPSSSYRI